MSVATACTRASGRCAATGLRMEGMPGCWHGLKDGTGLDDGGGEQAMGRSGVG